MTIEDLAIMVKRGFDQTATKEDIHELEQRVGQVEQRMATKEDIKDIWEELNATHADVRHIRSTVDALVHSDIAQEAAIEDLISRVHRLEQKVGLAR